MVDMPRFRVPRRKLPESQYPGGPLQTWVDAVAKFDAGNKAPLVELLKFGPAPPKTALFYVGDMLERHTFKRGRRTPAYTATRAVAQLDAADNFVRTYVAQGATVEEAVEQGAINFGVPVEALHLHHVGRHSSARRARKRRPPKD